MNETSQNNYLTNSYVLIGSALLIYWFIQKRNLVNKNLNKIESASNLYYENSKSFNAFIASESKQYKVPKQLVIDAKKMSKKECAQTILDNQNMINKTKMSQDERQSILNMVDYLENKLDEK
jgi:hypothetical protein